MWGNAFGLANLNGEPGGVSFGKSLCQVLRRRCHLIVEPWGFCPGHGRLYQPFILAQHCEVSWEYANLMYMCFVNLEKAYDCVSPSKVCLVSTPVCNFHGKDINRQPRLARCPVWGAYHSFFSGNIGLLPPPKVDIWHAGSTLHVGSRTSGVWEFFKLRREC